MKAVILAAGKSTRTYPLTLTRPKPLLKVANKTIIEHTLDNLVGIVDEVIIIVGYFKDQLIKFLGKKYRGIKITYIEQKQQLGTGHALLMAKKHVKGKFLMMAGDDIYSSKDIKKCLKFDYAILTSRVKNPENFGVIIEKKGILVDFIEKPKKFISDKINTSFYVFEDEIFNYIKKIKKTQRGELELPDAIKLLSKDKQVHCIPTTFWIPIGYPWDLLRADMLIRKGKNSIGRSKINGKAVNSCIGNNCIIYGTVKNSIVMDDSVIDKGSIVENSIIGSNVVFRGKIISKNTYSFVKDKKIQIGNFGSVIGDDCILENVSINPGIKISPNKSFKNTIIKKET